MLLRAYRWCSSPSPGGGGGGGFWGGGGLGGGGAGRGGGGEGGFSTVASSPIVGRAGEGCGRGHARS